MKIGILKETASGEQRVALVPESVKRLGKKNFEVFVQSGAGTEAGFPDEEYGAAGAQIIADAASLVLAVDAVIKVQPPDAGEIELFRKGQSLVSIIQPLHRHDTVKALAAAGVSSFSLDSIPRTTLAQSMDILSSMSTIAGYKAVLIAADRARKLYPMLMTAAGTVAPARVLVLGAGVAGLMACSTAKRLGAVVEAFDVRPVVKEQVQSVGARFIEVPAEESGEGQGGYAKEMSEDYKRKQQELIARHIALADAVIPTALIPGRKAPILVTEEMVKSMRPGSVIVDLAAEMGGNCALTVKDQEVVRHGVIIIGHSNLPSMLCTPASQMLSRNIEKYLLHLTDGESLGAAREDEIVKGSTITRDGEVVHELTKKIMAAAGTL